MLKIFTTSKFSFRDFCFFPLPVALRLRFRGLAWVAWVLLCCSVPVVKGATSVTLEWDKSTDINVAGYKIYYGISGNTRANKKDAGKVNTFSISNLTAGSTYYFSVTAVSIAGMESLPSNEVSFTASSSPVPNAPDEEAAALFDTMRETLIAMGLDNATILEIERFFYATYASQAASQVNTASNRMAAASPPHPPLPSVPLIIETVSPPEDFDESSFSQQEDVVTEDLEVKVSEMQLSAEGYWSFAVLAPVDTVLEIYGSADLTTWELLDTTENSLGMVIITEEEEADFPQQYYKVLPASL